MEKAERLCALHRLYWIFPNADLAVKNPASVLKDPDEITPKVLDANEAVLLFRRGQLHAVEAAQPTIHRHPQEISR